MKIKSIKSYIKKLALKKPYTIAYNTYSTVELVFVEIELANGIIGLGTGSPAEDVVGESATTTLKNIQSNFIENLVGRDIRHFQQIIFEVINQFPNLPGTQAAIDIALHDAFCKYLGIPVVDFYGRKLTSLPTSVTIGIKSINDSLAEAAEYGQLGFTILKIKTGIEVAHDIELVTKIVERFKNKFTIRVDANQGYTLNQLKQFLQSTEQFKIELIEQPVAVGNEAALLPLSSKERNSIAADESIKNAASALQFATNPKPFGIFNIKLMKCGGLMGAQQIANIAYNAGIDLFWGCNDESILSITAAIHIAYANSNTKYLDLDGSLDLAEDLVNGGFTLRDGHMIINQAPGFGTSIIA